LDKRTHTKGANAGSFLSFFPSNASDGTKPHIKVIATTGSNVDCWSKNGDAITTQTRPLETEIDIVCAPTIDVGQPMPIDVVARPSGKDDTVLLPCVSKFVWASKYGCPVCTVANLGYADGQCKKKKKLRSYLRTSNCHGGEPLPKPKYITCQPDGWILAPGEVAGLAVSASIFVVIIAMLAVFVHKRTLSLSDKNRLLRAEYDNLSGSTQMATRRIPSARDSST